VLAGPRARRARRQGREPGHRQRTGCAGVQRRGRGLRRLRVVQGARPGPGQGGVFHAGARPGLTRQASLLVRSDFEQANPAEVQRVVDVFVRAARWSSDEKNRDELFRIWARSGTPVASWAAEFDQQQLAVRNSPLVDDFIVGRYKAVVADALKLKLIRREVSVDDWFDTRYLKNALKKQGLENYWTAFDAKGRRRPANRSPRSRCLIPRLAPSPSGERAAAFSQDTRKRRLPSPQPSRRGSNTHERRSRTVRRPATRRRPAPTRAPLPWRRIAARGRRALPWLLPLALLALWFTGAEQGWISPQVLPPPQFVWETLRDLATSGDLWLHVSTSFTRVGVGFAIGTLLGLVARFGHGPVAPLRGLCAAHLQCAGADPGAGLAALRAAARGHRRAAEIHPHRQGGAGAGGAEHAAGLSARPRPRCARWATCTATAGASRCWRSCCRTPCPRSSPACGWASPRPGCRWWWWSWWRRAKGWATSSSTAASCSSSTW
jgi:hypothetical protein